MFQVSSEEGAYLKPDGVVLKSDQLGGKAVAKCATYKPERSCMSHVD